MTKYAHINSENILQGWYDSEIHTTIPTPNIEVTDEQWQNALNNIHNKINADGSSEFVDTETAEQKAEAQNRINKKASGKQKLKDLGLDDDEIQALMGA
jgi:hypothetical protein|tara:strand:+ start:673 stop:969 length:297 start_codon:yes stop_codon:yes gene_type:complete